MSENWYENVTKWKTKQQIFILQEAFPFYKLSSITYISKHVSLKDWKSYYKIELCCFFHFVDNFFLKVNIGELRYQTGCFKLVQPKFV